MKRKIIPLIIILFLTLSACEFPPPTPSTGSGQAEEPAAEVADTESEAVAPEESVEGETETQSETETGVEETQDDAAPAEEEESESPALSEIEGCLSLLKPLDGANFAGNTRVTFAWEAHPEADSYLLTFIFPDGLALTFTTDETTLNRYMDGFSMHPAYNQSGEHLWSVSALNTAGEEICQSETFSFTKAISELGSEENGSHGNGSGDSGGVSGGEDGGDTHE